MTIDDLDIEERDTYPDMPTPLWAVASALKLGYVGAGVIARVARTIAECYWQAKDDDSIQSPG
jgi:hypothetical protein